MGATGNDSLGGTAIAEVDDVQISAHFARVITTILDFIQPELTTTVQSPTLDAGVVKNGTGMESAGTNCLGGITTTEVNC